jgi:hypothetical protein
LKQTKMDNTELRNYVAQSRAKGVSDAEIVNQLRASGWPQAAIEESLGTPTVVVSAPSYNPQTVPGMGAWVAFQYVLMFVSLAFAASAAAPFSRCKNFGDVHFGQLLQFGVLFRLPGSVLYFYVHRRVSDFRGAGAQA